MAHDADATVPPGPHPDTATLAPAATAAPQAVEGVRIPGYEIEAELGRGGMGVVYKARQLRPSRPVAIKMILAGSHASSQDLIRFLGEAEAIAKLQHPNIVQVYEVGQCDGKPYFSLEFCAGGSLAHKLNGTPLPPREAAKLVETLAHAVEHAHEAGIVHRDLKPANVLLGSADDTEPKITDFGLAKQAGSDLTASGAIMGTPSYMAPEQADGKKGIGPPADVYALGAILYECLTGRPPFRAATPLDTIMQVVSEEPVAPRQLNPQIPRDLEVITLKCLHKDAKKRYASASALADDLLRFQNDEPISARPVGRRELFARWCRKNPWRAVGVFVSAGLLGLCIGLLISMVTATKLHNQALSESLDNTRLQKDRADQEAKRAKNQTALAEENEAKAKDAAVALDAERTRAVGQFYASNLGAAVHEWRLLNSHRARQMLDDCPPAQRGWEWDMVKGWMNDNSVTLRGHSSGMLAVALSPDGRRAYTLSTDGTTRSWDTRTSAELFLISKRAHRMALSPDGKKLALAVGGVVYFHDAITGREQTRHDNRAIVCGLEFIGDGTNIGVVLLNGDVKFRHVETYGIRAEVPKDLKLDSKTLALLNHGHGVAISRDGSRLAQGGTECKVRVWDAKSGDLIMEGEGHLKVVGQVAFHPNGKLLASPGGEGEIRIWDIEKKSVVRSLRGHRTWVWGVAFSPDGRRLVSESKDTSARVWNPETGESLLTLIGHSSEVWNAAIANDETVVTGSPDATARVWNTSNRVVYAEHVRQFFQKSKLPDFGNNGSLEFVTFFSHVAPCGNVALSADGRLAASSAMGDDQAHQVTVWNVDERREVLKIAAPQSFGHQVQFTPDANDLFVGSGSSAVEAPSKVRRLAIPAGVEAWSWTGPPCLFAHVTLSPATGLLIVVIQTRAPSLPQVSKENIDYVIALDAKTGKELYKRPLPGTATHASLSPDGKELVIANTATSEVIVYDAETGKPKRQWVAANGGLTDVAVGSNGLVATSDTKAVITIWQLADGKKLRDLEGHVGTVMSMAFSPDGRRLFTCATDFMSRLWNVDTGRELLAFRDHIDIPMQVAWSADGRRLATADKGGAMRIWTGPKADDSSPSDQWPILYTDTFDRPELGPYWMPTNNSIWAIRDGKLIGTQAMHKDTYVFPLANAGMHAVELPKQVDIQFRYRAAKPMVVSPLLFDPTGLKLIYGALLCGKCLMPQSPMAYLMQITRVGVKAADMRITQVGVHRKFDMEANRWYAVRVRRDPERMRVWVDGQPILDERIQNEDLPRLALQASWSGVGDETEFDDLVIRSPESAVREQRIRQSIRKLMPEVLVQSEAIRRVASELKLDAADKPIVEQVAREFPEDVSKLETSAWDIAKAPDREPDDYALALKQAEAAARAKANDAEIVATLALCRFRVGDYGGAIADADQAAKLARTQHGAAVPSIYAILAMAHHRLGKAAEAQAYYRRLRDLMLCDRWKTRAVALGFLAETEKLLGPAPAGDLERDAITRAIMTAEQAGWQKHDIETYLKQYSADVTVRGGRTEKPDRHDVVLNRRQMETLRRLQFRSPAPTNGVDSSIEDVEVTIAKDEATWRARWTVHVGTVFDVMNTISRLRRERGDWKIVSTSTWPVSDGIGDRPMSYDAQTWVKLDAEAEALKDSPDFEKRILALRAAKRFGDAYEVARQVTDKPNAPAWVWVVRGEMAMHRGDFDDATTALQKAESLDPAIALPWVASRLRVHFREHQASVGGLEFHPDGKRVFSSGVDKQARLWEANSGRVIRSLTDLDEILFGGSITHDGSRCAASGKVIHIWDLETGKTLAVCTGHTGVVYRLGFRHDDKRIVSASADKTARVWDAATGKELLKLAGHTDDVLGATYSPDGRVIATCSHDSTIRLWDAETGKPIQTLTGSKGKLKRVVFNPAGSRLASCGEDAVIRVWDVKSGKVIQSLKGHGNLVDVVRFSPDGSRLASADFAGIVRVWDTATGKLQCQVQTERGAIFALAFSPDQKRLAAGGHDGVYIWSIAPDPLGD
jgi:WD40 repeat protein